MAAFTFPKIWMRNGFSDWTQNEKALIPAPPKRADYPLGYHYRAMKKKKGIGSTLRQVQLLKTTTCTPSAIQKLDIVLLLDLRKPLLLLSLLLLLLQSLQFCYANVNLHLPFIWDFLGIPGSAEWSDNKWVHSQSICSELIVTMQVWLLNLLW